MLIKDIVTLAKFGELSSVSTRDNVEAIVSFINMGMLELYGRFTLKTGEHVIDLDSNVNYYTMPEDFMIAVEAFGEAHYSSEKQVKPIGINDPDDEFGVYFTSWNILQVPDPEDGARIALIYLIKPTPVTVEQVEDGVSVLDLPDTLVDPLLHYIGYRGHLGVKSDSQAENNSHWARFERSCKRIGNLGTGTPVDTMTMATRICSRGFV